MLVNNAGYGSYGALEDVPIDEARRQFEVNVFGLARLTQLVTTAHARAGVGSVINISSIGGKSTSHSAAGTTRPSSPWKASATACPGCAVWHQGRRDRARPIRTEWDEIARDSLAGAH